MKKIDLIKKSRYLREVQTKEEQILWKLLRNDKLGFKFRRQHPIDRFVLDFYCPKKKLCIEIDGNVHNKHTKEYDNERENYLAGKGIKIIRFWNNEINKDIVRVINTIKKELLI